MLGEAYSIFSDPELGGNPESPNAKIAKQNLLIARSNALNQLWMSVVTDQVLKLGELDGKNYLIEIYHAHYYFDLL